MVLFSLHILEWAPLQEYVERDVGGLELGEELLTSWFLAFLAVVWIAVFLPGAARARRRTPLPAATRFKKALGTIAPPRPAPRTPVPRPPLAPARNSGRWIIVPKTTERVGQREAFRQALARRRRWFALLVLVAVGTAAAAFVYGETWLEINLLADGILVFYAAFLFETKRRRDERVAKVRTIKRSRAERETSERLRAGGHSY